MNLLNFTLAMKLINLKKFLDTNSVWKQFFNKNKEEFKNIRERLIEISEKLGISVTDFKKLVSRIQKGEKDQELKKEMVVANLRLVILLQKNIQTGLQFLVNSRRKYWFNESCR